MTQDWFYNSPRNIYRAITWAVTLDTPSLLMYEICLHCCPLCSAVFGTNIVLLLQVLQLLMQLCRYLLITWLTVEVMHL